MLYTDREETEKILREGRRLNDMSDIEYIEEYIRPIMDKYDSSRKSGQYWEKLPDGSDNPYGKEFYDYVKENNVKFSKVPSIRKREMYNTEYNRRTGEINPPWHELPNWEKALRLLGSII